MSDPVTASTPPLVGMIAEVIADNSVVIHDHPDYGEMTASTLTPDEMARAVLDALEKVGSVEWGVRLSDGSVEETHDQSAAQLVCLDWPSTEAVVSRITGPWTAAEG